MDALVQVVLVFFLFVETALSQDIFGCGGFIRSHQHIDLSKIQVKLLSKSSGLLKFKTDCAPNSGYYLIPLYDKGEYVLTVEGPEGWSFAPSEVELLIDGKTDLCSKQEDINFDFTGFAVKGQAVSKGTHSGPKGLTLNLYNEEKVSIQETQTFDDGSFEFRSVYPGSYSIHATHSQWDTEKSSMVFKVSSDSVNLDPFTFVLGYNVRGRVQDGSSPVAGVEFLMSSEEGSPITCKGPGEKECAALSDEKGTFEFPSIPPGRYKLVPHFSRDGTVFQVAPDALLISVEHGTHVITETFAVKGFKVKGHVLLSEKGTPVGKAKVYVDGRLAATTAADGSYEVLNLSSGTYTISVEAEDLNFEPMEQEVSSLSPILEDMVPSKYSVCGKVHISETNIGGFSMPVASRRIRARETDLSENAVSTSTDSKGMFCFSLKPGTYDIQVEVSQLESSLGLLLLPLVQQVHVREASIKDLSFTQYTTTLTGRVTCKEPCPRNGFVITFERQVEQLEDNPVSSPNQMIPKNKVIDFTFSNVLAGKYFISISYPSWCWEDLLFEVDITPENTPSVHFKQTGYGLNVTSSHNTTLLYQLTKKPKPGDSPKLSVAAGSNAFCLKYPGIYTLSVIDDCRLFETDTFAYDTSSPLSIVSLMATKHLVVIEIHVPKDSKPGVSVRVVSLFEKDPEADLTVHRTDNGTEGDKILYFHYQASTSDRLEINIASTDLIFSKDRLFHDVSQECPQYVPVVTGSMGMVVMGTITPPIKGVVVTITNEENKNVSVETDENGVYKAGPFMSDAKLNLTAELEGYIFQLQEGSPFDFRATILSMVIVKVEDANGAPLSGALVSLSGTNFRSNGFTESNGELRFSDLADGDYHIRPFYREYQFNPTTKDLTVTEGSNETVVFSGSRIAFRCFGKVQSLNGQGIENVTVKLSTIPSDGCMDLNEQTATDEKGLYSISGLVTNCQYEVSVEYNLASIKTTPEIHRLTGTAADVTGIDFFAMPISNKLEISGFVSTDPSFISFLRVSLIEMGQTQSPLHSVTLDTAGFFYMPSITYKAKAKYLIQLETVLSHSQYHFNLSSEEFQGVRGTKHFNMEFHAEEVSLSRSTNRLLQFLSGGIIATLFLLLGLSKVFGIRMPDVQIIFNHLIGNNNSIKYKKH